MSITIKNSAEQESMRKGGAILAKVLDKVCKEAQPGVSTYQLDQIAEKMIIELGGKPGFKGFNGFPSTICSAVDEIIVHGFPSKEQILKEGDLFTVDCGVILDGLYTDAARSIGIGKINEEKSQLIKTARLALKKGIAAAKPENYVGDISKAIAQVIEKAGFYVIHNLTGHGLGRSLHEEPTITNYWDGQKGAKLKPGMTIAIEPIFSSKTHKMKTLKDKWTIVTKDGSCSVQEENTVLITQNGNEVLTELK